jgi:membrane protein YdbS with pleckstrin-like domain
MTDRWPRTDEWPGEEPDGHHGDVRRPAGLEDRGRSPQAAAAPARPWDGRVPSDAGSADRVADPDQDVEQDPERVIARFRPHARRLFWPIVAAIVVGALGGFALGIFRADWAWMNLVVAGVVLFLLLVGSVLPLVRWLGHRTLVTTRRLVITSGLVVRTRHELLHSRGYDVTVRRTGLQGVFRTGDVLVFPGEDRPLVIDDVPSADLVVAVLHDLVEAHDRRRPRSEPRWDDIIGGGAGPAN